jgi:hypothetical protein
MSDSLQWTYYDSLSPEAPPNSDRQMPTMQSRNDLTNPEMDIYNDMIRQKGAEASKLATEQVQPKAGGGAGAEATKMEEVLQEYTDDIPVKAADISNPSNISDFIYIVIAVVAVEFVVIFITRFYPELIGRNLNRWYDLFGLNAVIADVIIVVLGFVIARYLYKYVIAPKFLNNRWSPLAFTGTAVGVQIIHDILFYFLVIQQVPRGNNVMIDVFKDYAASSGAKAIGGDSLIMIGSVLLAIVLKSQPKDYVAAFGFLASYAIPYILYTRNQFTVLR